MQKAAQSPSKTEQNINGTADGPSRLRPRQSTSSGSLAQLAAMMNRSPRVQAQLRLAKEINHENLVQGPAHDDPPAEEPANAPIQRVEAPNPNRTGLPDQLKTGVENLSGLSLDDVKVHYNSDKPAHLNALAYAQGTDIHVAPGQEKHLPHEAWHIVQQKQGRVRPTMQMRAGVPVNDDGGLEHEADVMAAKAAFQPMPAQTITHQSYSTARPGGHAAQHCPACGRKSTEATPVQRLCQECEKKQPRSIAKDNESHGGIVQPKLIINGTAITDQEYLDLGWDYLFDEAGKEIVDRMHNQGKAPDFTFATEDQLRTEIEIRRYAIRGMEAVHKGCCSYPDKAHPNGYLNPKYWKKQGWMNFVPNPRAKAEASEFIEAIFKPGAKTKLECLTMTVAIEYYSMLKGLGRQQFNKKFPKGAGLVISQESDAISTTHKGVTVSKTDDLLPGDWVYFKNFSDYLTQHPDGYWQGENAIYLGNGKYRGFGTDGLTEEQMNQKLVDAYQVDFLLKIKDTDDLKKDGGGLLLDKVIRPDMDNI